MLMGIVSGYKGMRFVSIIKVAILALALSWGAASAKPALKIAVASNFYNTLQHLKPKIEQTCGCRLKLITGSSGSLYQQLVNGLPADIYLSANADYPKRLVRKGFAIPQSRTIYARGILAFWSNTVIKKQNTLEWQLSNKAKIVIANPRFAPYGLAAKQYLVHEGLWRKYKDNIILANNVAQAASDVKSGAVSGGFVALSQIPASVNRTKHVRIIPQKDYRGILQEMVVLNKAYLDMDPVIKPRDYASKEIQITLANPKLGRHPGLDPGSTKIKAFYKALSETNLLKYGYQNGSISATSRT